MDTDLPSEFLDFDLLFLSATTGVMVMIQPAVAGAFRRWFGRRGRVCASSRGGTAAARNFQVEDVSAALAHELRQPLTAIMCTSQAARRLIDRGSADRALLGGMLEEISRAGQHASDVIQRVQAMTRRDAAEFRTLDLNEVVAQSLRLLRRDLARRGISLTVELGGELPSVNGDAVQLAQVIANLVGNASDAMAGAPLEARELVVRTAAGVFGEVCVTVVDSGPGLPPEMTGKLFQPFQTTKPHGTGLGLAISRSIAQRHLGDLSGANREDGPGAEFVLTLPVAPTGEESPAPHEASPDHLHHR